MTDASNDRRDEGGPDNGRRRRGTDSFEALLLLRDKVLLIVGTFVVCGVAIAAVFIDIKNPEIALAALTVGGGLLGGPAILRLDEARQRRRNR